MLSIITGRCPRYIEDLYCEACSVPTEISVIVGTNAFGKFDYVPGLIVPFDTVEKPTPILDSLQSSGVKQLDTARLYGQRF